MSHSAFGIEEFMKKDDETNVAPEETSPAIPEENAEIEEIDVQKAVVESLAEDKAKLLETNEQIVRRIADLENELKEAKASLEKAQSERDQFASEAKAAKESENVLKQKLTESEAKVCALEMKQFDDQERNPNALALLDRDVELPDRFPGETRDHVLEVIKESRERAETEGRVRRAQILESVLVANEPNGNLAKKRAQVEQLFAENANILSGPVIEALKQLGISHKNGEEYLLTSEIITRNF